MKILLFGEYSGFFNCLKEGFLELGHEVFLASDGNGYKNYPSDFRWDSKINFGRYKAILEIPKILFNKKLMVGFDVVLIIAPDLFTRYRFPNKLIFDFLKENNNKVYLIGAGDTAIVFDYWYNKKDDKYHHYMAGYLGELKQPEKYRYNNNPDLKAWENELISQSDGYIPIWYEYAQPFRGNPKLKKTIPIPITVNKFKYSPNIVKNKIVFFHGKSRACKGGKHIIAAFDRLKDKEAMNAIFEYSNRLPFAQYIELLDKTNVILDDANSYSLGMNALISMAKGKIVMGGAEELANKELNYSYNPAINIHPNSDQIAEAMQEIISNKNLLEEMGYKSRKFVEDNHDYINIAQQYIEIFK